MNQSLMGLEISVEPDKWHQRFINLAKEISTWSKDPSTQVGAIIVGPKRRIVSVGYNGFPRGVPDLCEHLDDRKFKYKLISHAERNALDNCIEPTDGYTIYSTLYPCSECAKSIIQKGIKRVVALPKDDSYYDRLGWEYTDYMFNAANIEVTFIESL